MRAALGHGAYYELHSVQLIASIGASAAPVYNELDKQQKLL